MISADDSPYELLKRLPLKGSKGREQLNNFIKRVRSGQLTLEELVSAIRAYESIISMQERVSPAYGGLLSHLFSQLELNWRAEVLGADIRSVQLVLLKKILVLRPSESDAIGSYCNLAIWTAGFKDIRMLSGQAKEFVLTWILANVNDADKSDWPVIFHNLILMSGGNYPLLTKVFEGIDGCLRTEYRPLLDHLIFLISQNASLGKLWVKWVLNRGAFKISPLIFSGLLSLSQLDTEYGNTLNGALQSNLRLMVEIWTELKRVNININTGFNGGSSGFNGFNGFSGSSGLVVVDPVGFLKMTAKWIGSDSEMGIRGALQLIDRLKGTHTSEMTEFYLELFRQHPFARRELLCHQEGLQVWHQIHAIDSIILKEHVSGNGEKIRIICREAPELLCNLIEHEDQLLQTKDIEALISINSVLFIKALKKSDFLSDDLKRTNFLTPEIHLNWNEMSIGEISILKQTLNLDHVAKMVELCELLLIPSAVNTENREHLIDLAVEFVANGIGSGVYSERERILMISKLISTIGEGNSRGSGSFEGLLKLFEQVDWNNYAATLKFILEKVSTPSISFYKLIPRIPTTVEFQILVAKALCRFSDCELNENVSQFIGSMAERVVSEPQLSKSLLGLLGKKYSKSNEIKPIPITKFTEISDPGMIRLIVEFGLEYNNNNNDNDCIEGIKGEIVKSILMYYGVIEDSEKEAMIQSKFKNIHLNEKSINFSLNSLLNQVQRDLEMAQKLVKSVPELVEGSVDDFLRVWLEEAVEVFAGLTRGLISGRGAVRLHGLLSSFYELCTKIIQMQLITVKSGHIIQTVASQLNKQVYAMIPLQQDKIQSVLKQEMNLKKDKSSNTTTTMNQYSGKSVTKLIFEMERFEENLIKRVRGGEKWCDKIVRSTARDFKIRLEHL